MKCIIPCAGGSSRMRAIPKSLLRLKDEPLLCHVISFWEDKVDGFVFIVRREATYLWPYLPSNSAIVFQDEAKGLADAIMRAAPFVYDRFVIALSDCLNVGEFQMPKMADLGIGVWETDNEYEIRKSYGVNIEDGVVTRVWEKPARNENGLCGMGTYFMDTRVFIYIREALPYLKPSGGDFTEVLQMMIDQGETIYPNYFEGAYININSPEDMTLADDLLREKAGR